MELVIAGLVLSLLSALLAVLSVHYGRNQNRHLSVERDHARWRAQRDAISSNRAELVRNALKSRPENEHLSNVLLTSPCWNPPKPISIEHVAISVSHKKTDLRPPERSPSLPLERRSVRYTRYSSALRDLARPRLLEDRLSYRVLDLAVTGTSVSLTCELMTYFDFIDQGEAMAHEWQAESERRRKRRKSSPIRAASGDLLQLSDRNCLASVNVITLVRSVAGELRFFLHDRDGESVASAGDLVHVAPCGVFQPVSNSHISVERDAEIWRCCVREYVEEFLGCAEARDSQSAPVDYLTEHPYRDFAQARLEGTMRTHFLGAGVDPLTGCLEVLCACVFDEACFNSLFARLVHRNEEGQLLAESLSEGRLRGLSLGTDTLRSIEATHRIAPAARACIELAIMHSGELAEVSEP